jgi:hypothetical protein
MGEARFRCTFERTVTACVCAGIAKGEVVHIDASLLRPDAVISAARSIRR